MGNHSVSHFEDIGYILGLFLVLLFVLKVFVTCDLV